MHKTLIAALAASALVLAACGSDSDGGGGAAQSELAALLTESLDEEGIPYDADCISDTISQFSDEDAEAIIAAGIDSSPDLSDEGDAIGASVAECFELES